MTKDVGCMLSFGPFMFGHLKDISSAFFESSRRFLGWFHFYSMEVQVSYPESKVAFLDLTKSSRQAAMCLQLPIDPCAAGQLHSAFFRLHEVMPIVIVTEYK